jgi:hypothetical protein
MKMNLNGSHARGSKGVVALLGLTGLLLTTASSGAMAGSSGFDSRDLTGAWSVQVTLRDCATNAPLGPSFNALVSFHEGGTVSENAGGTAFPIGQRGAGHGTWTQRGRHTYRQKMIALIHFETAPNLPGTPSFDPTKPITPGFFAGWQTVTHTVELEDANHLTSAGTNAFYRTDGTVYRTGCSTAAGERFR